MAWQSPLDPPGTRKDAFINVCEWIFLTIFTVEMLTKILAYGFALHKGAYLRDAWCQLDFVVVTLAWLPIIFPNMGNYSVLRAFRALRPLRALKRLPGMPLLIQWILEVLPKLGTVMLLCGFIFLVFGIVGMELFKGSLHYRCALPASSAGRVLWTDAIAGPPPLPSILDGIEARRLSSTAGAFDTGITCNPDKPTRCETISTDSFCMFFEENRHGGLESFDNIPLTFVMLFQCITFDGWASPMFDIMAYFSDWASIYFLLMVVLGGFFVVNLFLAVIFLEFESTQNNITPPNSPRKTSRRLSSEESESPLVPADAQLSDGAGFESEAALVLRQRRRGCCDCMPQPGTLRHDLSKIATSQELGNAATALVLLNMALMCMPYEGMSDEYAASLEYYTSWITWLFIAEMSFKVFALGCGSYWADNWNRLDGTIVIMSVVEIVLMWLFAGAGVKLSFLRMLRMLRVLRVLRLMKSWRGLYVVITTLIKAFPQMTNIGILVALASFIFALLGMTLFGAIFTPENGFSADSSELCVDGVCPDGSLPKPRAHFDYCFPAMLSIFIVLTGEWVDVMEAVTGIVGGAATAFFLAVVVIGKYLLVNLLIAVILSEFGGDDEEPATDPNDGHSLSAEELRLQAVKERMSVRRDSTPGLPDQISYNEVTTEKPRWAVSTTVMLQAEDSTASRIHHQAVAAIVEIDGVVQTSGMLAGFQMDDVRGVASPFTVPIGQFSGSHAWHAELFVTAFPPEDGDTPPVDCYFWNGSEIIRLYPSLDVFSLRTHSMTSPVVLSGKSDTPPWPTDYSLFCFNRLSPVRRFCQWILEQSWFTTIIMLSIGISSICLAIDTPRLDPDSSLAFYVRRLDLTFIVVFTLEMMFKVIAFGFYFSKDAYIKDPWNQMDFLIVVVSLVVLLAEAIPQLRGLRVLRLLRALRPLRVVSKSAGLKLIISTLFRSMPAVANVFGVMLALQLIFAILGLQLFSGAMASCSEPTITTRAECLANPDRDWSNPTVGSFDSFSEAMRLLYVMSSGDNWAAGMYSTMDVTEAGRAPVRNDFSMIALFSIAWMLIGNIFAQNLVVGVVVDDFSKRQNEETGAGLLTPAQKQWVDAMSAMARRQPTRTIKAPRQRGLRRWIYHLVTGWAFDGVITAVIVMNIVLMSFDYYRIEEDLRVYKVYTDMTTAITSIYYVECVLKLLGFGCAGYFSDAWCRFDFFLVCTSLLDQFATELLAQYLPLPPMLLRVLRVFRILRILRLLKGAKDLRNLIVTVVLSIPSLANVASILGLVIYVYAVLGVQLFTFVAPGEIINDTQNFHSIGPAALVLFQCLTGDGWSSYMSDTSVTEEGGTCSEAEGNCGSSASVPFFISFQLVGCFIFLNLFVAVILENFSTLHHSDPNLVSSFDLEVFNDAWAQFDPDATNFIPATQLSQLLLSVPRPIGLKGVTEKVAARMCLRLALPSHMGMVAYSEVLNELIHNNYFRSGTHDGISEVNYLYDEKDFEQTAEAAGVAPEHQQKPPVDLASVNSAHAQNATVLRYEPKYVQTAETVAHIFALKKIAKLFDHGAIDRWRLRALRLKHQELLEGRQMRPGPGHKIGSISGAHTAMADARPLRSGSKHRPKSFVARLIPAKSPASYKV